MTWHDKQYDDVCVPQYHGTVQYDMLQYGTAYDGRVPYDDQAQGSTMMIVETPDVWT